MPDVIRLSHGFGGKMTQDLLDNVILPAIQGSSGHQVTLDAAVIDDLAEHVVISTDSFTVSPQVFPGGDIGKLAVSGTVNDIVMMGGRPQFITLGLIIEEDYEIDLLRTIMESVGAACRMTGTRVITGDTKVVEKGAVDGIFINTTGFGSRVFGPVGPDQICGDDMVILSGTLGDHGAAILNARENLGFSRTLVSDCAPLSELILEAARAAGTHLHALRDPTRGGLAATLNEFAVDSGYDIVIQETSIPIRKEVRAFLEILGLDVMILANEGKAVLVIAPEAVDCTLSALRGNPLGENAAVIGSVGEKRTRGRVMLETSIGTRRIIEMPLEEGLPRIC